MHSRSLPTLSLLCGATLLVGRPAPAQDYLHYKFDGGCGAEVINYAPGSPATATGTIVTNLAGAPAASWTPGVSGAALQGGVLATGTYDYVDTGWVPGTITGDMTWACWLRMDPAAPTPGLTYMIGNGSTFRVFTGGGGFFLTAGWGGSNVNTVANIQTLARTGWVHLACVLDGVALTGTYYINGVPETPVSLSGAVNWTGATTFSVGRHSSLTNANIFDLDEFLLVGRALSAADVAALVSGARAGDGTFGSTCGPSLAGNGQRPAIGNAGYGLQVSGGPQVGFVGVVFGDTRCQLGGTLPLPLDLGVFEPSLTGCQGHVDNGLGTVSQFMQNGAAALSFGLPNLPGLVGYTIYGQAITFDFVSSQLRASNALAVGIGL